MPSIVRLLVACALFSFALVALPGCPPSPSPPPHPDASDAAPAPSFYDAGPMLFDAASGDVFDIACLNLVAVGCPEGADPSCAATMRQAHNARVTDYSPWCVATQKTAEDIRACSPAWKNGCRGARAAP